MYYYYDAITGDYRGCGNEATPPGGCEARITAPVFPGPSKTEMWERIKAERDRRKENGGYPAAGKWFHSDVYSRTQILALVQLGANLPADIQWKTMDGTFLLLTPTIVGQMFQSAIAQDNDTFKAADVHRVAMEASADPASYDYSTGWPAIYGG